jgi:hypothetical protein
MGNTPRKACMKSAEDIHKYLDMMSASKKDLYLIVNGYKITSTYGKYGNLFRIESLKEFGRPHNKTSYLYYSQIVNFLYIVLGIKNGMKAFVIYAADTFPKKWTTQSPEQHSSRYIQNMCFDIFDRMKTLLFASSNLESKFAQLCNRLKIVESLNKLHNLHNELKNLEYGVTMAIGMGGRSSLSSRSRSAAQQKADRKVAIKEEIRSLIQTVYDNINKYPDLKYLIDAPQEVVQQQVEMIENDLQKFIDDINEKEIAVFENKFQELKENKNFQKCKEDE